MIENLEILKSCACVLASVGVVVLLGWYLVMLIKSILQVYMIWGAVGGMTKKELKRAECRHRETYWTGDWHDTHRKCRNCGEIFI